MKAQRLPIILVVCFFAHAISSSQVAVQQTQQRRKATHEEIRFIYSHWKGTLPVCAGSTAYFCHESINMNRQDEDGNTALILASGSFFSDVTMMELLDAGVDPNIKNNDGETALHRNARYGKPDVARLLIAAGAHLDVQNKWTLYTPLVIAIQQRNLSMVQLLIDAGAQLNIQNYCGQTPLIYAAANRHMDAVSLLIAAGADQSITDRHGRKASSAGFGDNDSYRRAVAKGLLIACKKIIEEEERLIPVITTIIIGYLDDTNLPCTQNE